MSAIGTRIRELRIAKGLTQTALSGRGISAGYVSLVESGKRTPSADMIARFADRLGVPVDQLVGEPAQTAPARESEQGRVELNFARLALSNGNPTEAIRFLDGLPMDALAGQSACDAELVLAESLQQTGQLDRAVVVLESLQGRCRTEQSWVTLAVCAATLTVMYLEFGDVNRAVDVARAALEDVEAAGLAGTDEHLRLGATLVAASFDRGDMLFATRRIETLIEVADRVGSTRARGSIYWNAGMVAHGRGRVDDALRLTDRAIALLADQEESRDLPRLRMQYAWLLLHRDVPLPEQALRQLDRAETDPLLFGARLDRGEAATLRGRAHLQLDHLDDAAEHAARALTLLGPSDHIGRASALLLLGDVGAARADQDLAEEAFREMQLVLGQLKPSREVARLWRALGDSLRTLGDVRSAVYAYDTSLAMLGMAASASVSRMRVDAA